MKAIGAVFILGCVLSISCNPPEQEITVFSISYDFTKQDNGWTGDFAEYPEGDSLTYGLFFKHDTLPTNLNANATKKALHLSGTNYSDDLFMFIKKNVSGLRPNTSYEVLFNVKFASNAPKGVEEGEDSPGESVYLKAGASVIEPRKQLQDGVYIMNIDKGNLGEAGQDMITIGTIGVATNTTQFTQTSRYNSSSKGFMINTDESGSIWFIIGTDSGFEGSTTLYYTQIDILFNQI